MAGVVLKCGKCGRQVRVGYPGMAVDFAMGFRQGDPEEIRRQLVDEFYANNPDVLRSEPEKCPACGAPASDLRIIHKYM